MKIAELPKATQHLEEPPFGPPQGPPVDLRESSGLKAQACCVFPFANPVDLGSDKKLTWPHSSQQPGDSRPREDKDVAALGRDGEAKSIGHGDDHFSDLLGREGREGRGEPSQSLSICIMGKTRLRLGNRVLNRSERPREGALFVFCQRPPLWGKS